MQFLHLSFHLQLRATLPIKPGDTDKNGTGRKQYNLSLNIPANLDGLKTAEEEAYELGKLIAPHTFDWNDKYLGNEAIKKEFKTIGELLEKFEEEYFKTHKRTTKSEHTFFYYFSRTKRFTNPQDLATPENLMGNIYGVTLIKVQSHPQGCDGLPLLLRYKGALSQSSMRLHHISKRSHFH